MKIKFLISIFSFLLLINRALFAQYPVFISTQNSEIQQIAKKCKLEKKYRKQTLFEKNVIRFVSTCQQRGYLSFAVDSIKKDSLGFHLYIFEGKKMTNPFITIPENEKKIIEEMGEGTVVKKGALAIENFAHFSEKIILNLENKGYPFAEIFLDSITISDTLFQAQLRIKKNPFILFDTIVLKGDAKLHKSFMKGYFNIKKGKPYDEKAVSSVPQKIRELPFVTEIYPSGIEFVEDKAFLYLFLNKKKVNFFDGYIGIVPIDERTGKVALAGEVKLNFKNLFGIGESLELLWRSPQRHSQYLKLHADFPYLFSTRLGVSGDFLLDKTDTTYLSTNYLLGVQYSFAHTSYLKTFIDVTSSNLLTTNLITEDLTLSHIDFSKTLYGIEFFYRNVDFIYNPTKGIIVNANIGVAQRKIRQNKRLPVDLYQDISLSSTHYRIKGEVAGFIPLHQRWVVKLSSQGGTLFGTNFFENELFKIGGLNSLRGFSEDELLATSYLIATTELRFLFGKLAYLNLFFNGAWYEKKSSLAYISDFPYGFGIGIAFETRAGLFYLSYALPKQFTNPISFKSGKIHFGLSLAF